MVCHTGDAAITSHQRGATVRPAATTLHARLAATGIGYAGIHGAWWLPATQPYSLAPAFAASLRRSAQGIFALLDVVAEYYGRDPSLTTLLDYKRPVHIPPVHSRAPVLSLRPDYQLAVSGVVVTELEICPSAQGFAHAMQLAYGLEPDLVPALARMLRERELIIVITPDWSEFIWEQLALCRALRALGATARVLMQPSIGDLAARVRQGELWQPPIFGVPRKPVGWDDDVLARIAREQFQPFLIDHVQAFELDSARKIVLFRFGYLENFEPALIAGLYALEQKGAVALNPTSFCYDSKVLMAAMNLPTVRAAVSNLNPTALAVLDASIPETHLLTPAAIPFLISERVSWVLKYAGFDKGNAAWGGRSLQVGAQQTDTDWQDTLTRYCALSFPVVAQRNIPSLRTNIDFIDGQGETATLEAGATRLRAFLLREDARCSPQVLGAHLTVSSNAVQVSEASDSVQAPISFDGLA